MRPPVTLANPFRGAIVADPWESGDWEKLDVPEIHAKAFDLCRRALEHVRSGGRSTSLLFYGAAGSGKTHLLGRLRAWLAGSLPTTAEPGPAVFISVRMQTSPQMMWRHLRGRFGEDLLRRMASGRTQLERILLHRLGTCCPWISDPVGWVERIEAEAPHSPAVIGEVERAIEALDDAAEIGDRDLLVVLGHLLLGRHRRDVRAWIRGQSLPEAALEQLGLGSERDEDPEERAREVVLGLTRLTGREIPIIFCFDQVEALQSHPQDLAGLHRFGQMIGLLRDESSNTLLISCILAQFLDTLNRAIISSDRDRLASFGTLPLSTLDENEAGRLVEARLGASAELAPFRARHAGERFWPLAEADVRRALSETPKTPRALLSWCAERFEQVWRPELIVHGPSSEEYLAQEVEERIERAVAQSDPGETGRILAHGLPDLLRLIDRSWEQKADSPLAGADLTFAGPRGQIVVALCNDRNLKTLAAQLRRLRDQLADQILEEPGRVRYVLARDVRLPIGAQAKRTRAYREELLSRGFRWIDVSAEMVAVISALRSVLSDAKAGDLASGGEAIGLRTVQAWVLANLTGRLRPAHDLLQAMLPDPSRLGELLTDEPDFNLSDDMSAQIVIHHLMSAEDLAFRLERTPEEIEACARRHPERFGLLSGPPPIIFQPTNFQLPESGEVAS